MRYSSRHIKLSKDIKAIYAVGDIHGDFVPFANDLVYNCGIENCAVIVCGDIGLGFYNEDKTEHFFSEMETVLATKNITVIFFRGNHDDPEWFVFKDDRFCDNFPHVIIAEDFSVVDYVNENTSYAVLLWGGAISIDRTRRKKNITYWENEPVRELTDEILDNINIEIDCVCTHSAPDFCLPVDSSNLTYWYSVDLILEDDLKAERETLSRGAYKLLNKYRYSLSRWYYGHYHDIYVNNPRMSAEMAKFGSIRFFGLDMFRNLPGDKEAINWENSEMFNRPFANHLVLIEKFAE